MINPKTFFSILGIILTIASYIPYFRDIFKGKTTPHAYTWFTFGIATSLIFALQVSAGAGIGAFITLAISIAVFSVFGLSLYKGEKNITSLDKLFLVLALISVVLWLIAKQPVMSAILLAIINILGFAPTIRKSWSKPFSETMSTYVINTLRQGITLLALEHYNIITYIYPLTATVITGLFVILLIVRRKTVPNPEIKTLEI